MNVDEALCFDVSTVGNGYSGMFRDEEKVYKS